MNIKIKKILAGAAILAFLPLGLDAANPSQSQAVAPLAVGATTSVGIAARGTVALPVTQFPQTRPLNCGAATLKAMLSTRGKSISWEEADQAVGTADGTWASDAEMQKGLNTHFNPLGANYVWYDVSENPSEADRQAFMSRIVKNTNDGWPTAIAVKEDADRKRLPGHPGLNPPIYHFVTLYGVSESGRTVYIADSVAGSPHYAHWKGTRAKFAFSANDLWNLMKGNGYLA